MSRQANQLPEQRQHDTPPQQSVTTETVALDMEELAHLLVASMRLSDSSSCDFCIDGHTDDGADIGDWQVLVRMTRNPGAGAGQ